MKLLENQLLVPGQYLCFGTSFNKANDLVSGIGFYVISVEKRTGYDHELAIIGNYYIQQVYCGIGYFPIEEYDWYNVSKLYNLLYL